MNTANGGATLEIHRRFIATCHCGSAIGRRIGRKDGRKVVWLTVREAAYRLQISEDAVRKRIQRDTIPHGKRSDGRVYVCLDSGAEDVSQKSVIGAGDQKILHYIDKLYSVWQMLSSTARRASLAIVVLSLLLLALSGGAASAEQKVTISGIGLKVPFVIFLIAGAVSLTFLISLLFSAISEQTTVEDEIIRLYESIGVDESTLHRSQDESGPGLFETSTNPVDVFGIALSTKGKEVQGTGLIWLFFYGVAPAAAQMAVGLKVSELLQPQGLGWVWILFILLGAFTSLTLYWGLSRWGGEPQTLTDKVLTLLGCEIVAALGMVLGLIVGPRIFQ